MKTIKEERTIGIVNEKVQVTLVLTEEFEIEEYLRQMQGHRDNLRQVTGELKKDLTSVMKEIKDNKRKQKLEIMRLIKDMKPIEDEAHIIYAKNLAKFKEARENAIAKHKNKDVKQE